eukprot:CAMPEP_0117591538 /NCGR_PEP_ID=MMETSP0784-20121206/71591_1 /TAXON_ID=39447 /ORGANISM="" /LENGTH=340 /DNA_ID=CAMNT_0005393277 /DNA_START=12 /DNA_END=1032 /DNA_ORIENTATION=-
MATGLFESKRAPLHAFCAIVSRRYAMASGEISAGLMMHRGDGEHCPEQPADIAEPRSVPSTVRGAESFKPPSRGPNLSLRGAAGHLVERLGVDAEARELRFSADQRNDDSLVITVVDPEDTREEARDLRSIATPVDPCEKFRGRSPKEESREECRGLLHEHHEVRDWLHIADTDAVPEQSSAGCLDGLEKYTGFWYRQTDGTLIGEVRNDGTLSWGLNFKQPHSSVFVGTRGELTLVLENELYTATLESAEASGGGCDRLSWSDGEVWLRGLEQFAGVWRELSGDAVVAQIQPDGCMVGLVDEMNLAGVTHSGELARGARGEGDHIKWSDGELWVRRCRP